MFDDSALKILHRNLMILLDCDACGCRHNSLSPLHSLAHLKPQPESLASMT